MTRIEAVTPKRAGLFARIVYRIARGKVGKIPEPLTLLAHHPWMLAGSGAFEMALERSKRLPKGLKELAEIRAATLVGCPF